MPLGDLASSVFSDQCFQVRARLILSDQQVRRTRTFWRFLAKQTLRPRFKSLILYNGKDSNIIKSNVGSRDRQVIKLFEN